MLTARIESRTLRDVIFMRIGPLSLVTDAKNSIAEVVADQDRPVGHLQHIDGPAGCQSRGCPAAGSSGSTGHEAVEKGFVARHFPSVGARHHHSISARTGAVPRSMLGDDRRVLVTGGEHVAGIESESERRDVGTKL